MTLSFRANYYVERLKEQVSRVAFIAVFFLMIAFVTSFVIREVFVSCFVMSHFVEDSMEWEIQKLSLTMVKIAVETTNTRKKARDTRTGFPASTPAISP